MPFPPSEAIPAATDALKPLAERMRPHTLAQMVGQRRLLAEGAPLRRSIEAGHVHSMILWGPPGCGKTTLALLLAQHADAQFVAISAVLCGLPEVREVLAQAQQRHAQGRRTVLFVDEVHRFNKAQQDAFLPHIERGSILFVGATTENPSFELNSALLSRCRVHVMEALSIKDIAASLRRALDDVEHGLGGRGVVVGEEQLHLIAQAADGDVRRALTLLEIAAELAVTGAEGEGGTITEATLAAVLADRTRLSATLGVIHLNCCGAAVKAHSSLRNCLLELPRSWLTSPGGTLRRRLGCVPQSVLRQSLVFSIFERFTAS